MAPADAAPTSSGSLVTLRIRSGQSDSAIARGSEPLGATRRYGARVGGGDEVVQTGAIPDLPVRHCRTVGGYRRYFIPSSAKLD